MRIAIDVGGTFTDLVAETAPGRFLLFKAPTTPEEPAVGVFDALRLAAAGCNKSLEEFVAGMAMLIHATTRATNAILANGTARTAFLTTAGHPDILLYREGGRREPFNNKIPFPAPYVPRNLTFEVPERIDAGGRTVLPLDEEAVRAIIEQLRERSIGMRARAIEVPALDARFSTGLLDDQARDQDECHARMGQIFG